MNMCMSKSFLQLTVVMVAHLCECSKTRKLYTLKSELYGILEYFQQSVRNTSLVLYKLMSISISTLFSPRIEDIRF